MASVSRRQDSHKVPYWAPAPPSCKLSPQLPDNHEKWQQCQWHPDQAALAKNTSWCHFSALMYEHSVSLILAKSPSPPYSQTIIIHAMAYLQTVSRKNAADTPSYPVTESSQLQFLWPLKQTLWQSPLQLTTICQPTAINRMPTMWMSIKDLIWSSNTLHLMHTDWTTEVGLHQIPAKYSFQNFHAHGMLIPYKVQQKRSSCRQWTCNKKPATSSRRSLQLEKRKDKSFLTNGHQKID